MTQPIVELDAEQNGLPPFTIRFEPYDGVPLRSGDTKPRVFKAVVNDASLFDDYMTQVSHSWHKSRVTWIEGQIMLWADQDQNEVDLHRFSRFQCDCGDCVKHLYMIKHTSDDIRLAVAEITLSNNERVLVLLSGSRHHVSGSKKRGKHRTDSRHYNQTCELVCSAQWHAEIQRMLHS